MVTDSRDRLGDRLKAYEAVETSRTLPAGVPFLARLDGRAFHTFTRGLDRPYHEPLSRVMIETARFLVEETHAAFAYTQSDEITLGFRPVPDSGEILFGGRLQKLVSVLASLATAKFNDAIRHTMPGKADALPVFDARVYAVPDPVEAANVVVWRALDATKNALSMAALAEFGPKALHRVHSDEKRRLLAERGIDFEAYPEFFRQGTLLRRETRWRTLTDSELARIPPAHRPTGPVERHDVVAVPMPVYARVANLVAVLFDGATPESRPPVVARSGGWS